MRSNSIVTESRRYLLAAVSLSACIPGSSLPGTSKGTFSVVGTLGTNTCGSGVNASNPWDFSMAMSEDGSTLYVENTDGTSQMSGTLSSTSATLSSAVTSNADATEAGAGTCDLTQSTSIAIDLNSASAPTRFTGTATYTYSAATGVSSTNDCTDQLASAGGPYNTLPCTVTYTLSGTKQ